MVRTERGRANMKKVSDLSVDELKALIKETLRAELEDMLGDPDEGLELREDFKEDLRRALDSTEPRIPAEEVFAEFGMKW